jgi:phage repressor protein C with HTH and peptisase S24 domain
MAASTDPDAYALLVSGNSMAPRMRPGEAVLVEPNHECQPGDEVVLGLRGGDRMVKEFVYQRRGRIGLDSIADHQERIEVAEEEVAFMHYVAGVFRVGSIRKRE